MNVFEYNAHRCECAVELILRAFLVHDVMIGEPQMSSLWCGCKLISSQLTQLDCHYIYESCKVKSTAVRR